MFTVVDKSLKALYRLTGYLAAAFIVLIAVLVLVNVISRLLDAYVPGMTEAAGYCMAAAGSLGLAYTFAEHGHIRVTLFVLQLRRSSRFYVEFVATLLAAGMGCYLAYYLIRMVLVSYDFGDRSDGSDEILIWIPQLPMAFGFTVFAIALVHAVVVGWLRKEIPGTTTAKTDRAGH